MGLIPFEGVIEKALDIVDKFLPDGDKKIQAQIELRKLLNEAAAGQVTLNKAEVESGSWLGKWRGALGWGLAGSAIYQFIVYPFTVSILLAFNPKYPVEKLPVLDWKQLGSILLGMLGLGG